MITSQESPRSNMAHVKHIFDVSDEQGKSVIEKIRHGIRGFFV